MNARRASLSDSIKSQLVRKHRPDYQIALFMGLLMMLGLVVMYAIGPQRAQVMNNAHDTDFYTATYFVIKQALSVGLALAAFFIMSIIPYKRIIAAAPKLLLVGFGLCALLLLFGNILKIEAIVPEINYAYRWFSLGALGTFQPAEFLKFAVLLFVAGFLGAKYKEGKINDLHETLIPLGVIMAIAITFVIVFQKDMGTGISLVAIVAAMLVGAGLNKRVGLMIAGAILAMGLLLIVTAPHRMERVATFFAGDSAGVDDGDAYHIAHAKIAIGTGGWGGVGIGNSVQATGYLPEAMNDSVFAIMGETFGFVGLVAILSIFSVLLLRILYVADRLRDPTSRLIVVGIFGWFGAHVILNVAAMTGIFPLTGITLPLLSFGGTSMLFIAGALGLVFQLSSYTVHQTVNEKERYEDTRSRGRVGRPRYASRGRL